MKKIVFVFSLIVFLGATVQSQETVKIDTVKAATDTSTAKIAFETDLYDFGDIAYASDGTHDFKFKNTGTTPLLISNAKGSCGCTVPTYPKNVPIAPGADEVIKVTYDTKRVGHFMKTVKVTSNTSERVKVITIRGKVLPEVKEPAFPANGTDDKGAVPFESH